MSLFLLGYEWNVTYLTMKISVNSYQYAYAESKKMTFTFTMSVRGMTKQNKFILRHNTLTVAPKM
jgi:hypothetical protein